MPFYGTNAGPERGVGGSILDVFYRRAIFVVTKRQSMRSPYIIETQELSFRFGPLPVLERVNLRMPEGCIYGFLGPNGAGKTTTIRLLLGLLAAHGQLVRVCGLSPVTARRQVLRQVGSLVERPSLYEHLTAKENMRLAARLRRLPAKRIGEPLKLVGLTKEASVAVRNFSLGMKQRLGLALALLSEPKLLILDEPTGGLDPEGIRDMRELLLALNHEKGTGVFLSSHLLDEVEKIADHVGVLQGGRLIFQGETGALRHAASGRTRIRTTDPTAAIRVLGSLCDALPTADSLIQLHAASDADTALAVRKLVEAGIDVVEVTASQHSLESQYLQLITPKTMLS